MLKEFFFIDFGDLVRGQFLFEQEEFFLWDAFAEDEEDCTVELTFCF